MGRHVFVDRVVERPAAQWHGQHRGEGRLGVHCPGSVGAFLGEELSSPGPSPSSPTSSRVPSQVHCISTEFTPRKHGGEKGVPFRVQIDTFKQNENGEYTEHLHSASCQIKVFKVGPPRLACPGPCLQARPPPPTPGSDARHAHSATWRPSKEP